MGGFQQAKNEIFFEMPAALGMRVGRREKRLKMQGEVADSGLESSSLGGFTARSNGDFGTF
jgi:hypothetical protein